MEYGHLTIEEREVLLKMQAQQASMEQIGVRQAGRVGTDRTNRTGWAGRASRAYMVNG